MRLLFLLQACPYPPTDGDRWKIYNLLQYLAPQHECHVLAFGDEADARALRQVATELPGLRVLGVFPRRGGITLAGRQVLALLGRRTFPSALRYESAAFTECLASALRANTYDLVHVDLVNLLFRRRDLGAVPALLSINDAASLRHRRRADEVRGVFAAALARQVAAALHRQEREWLPRYDAVHVVSADDAEYLRTACGADNVRVISICVDPAYLRLPAGPVPREGAVRVFTAGTLDEAHIALPLEEFVRDHWPRVRAARPGITLEVVGRTRQRGRLAAWLAAQPGVTYRAWVEDYPQTLAGAHIAAIFDRGGTGVKNRTLQALAAARATVAFREGFAGIDVRSGEHCLIADDLEAFAAHLLALVASPARAEELGRAARALVAARHTPEAIGRCWEELYQSIVRSSSRPCPAPAC
jgi:glycosyltransferase involved in cell wall biosynthesis